MLDHPDDKAHRRKALARYTRLRKRHPDTLAELSRRARRSEAAAHSWESGARTLADCRVKALRQWSTLIGHPSTVTLVDVAAPPTPGIELAARMLASATSDMWVQAHICHTWEVLESAVRWSPATPEELAARGRMDHLVEVDDHGVVLAHLKEVAARAGISANSLNLILRFQRPPMLSTWQAIARAVGGRCAIGFADDPFKPIVPS